MVPWTRMERRWRDALLGSMIPRAGDRPGLGELNLTDFWTLYREAAPPVLRFGLRVAVWSLTWGALFAAGRPFHRLEPARQDRLLERAAGSRWYLVRQLVTTLKLIACFAWLHDPKVRALVLEGR